MKKYLYFFLLLLFFNPTVNSQNEMQKIVDFKIYDMNDEFYPYIVLKTTILMSYGDTLLVNDTLLLLKKNSLEFTNYKKNGYYYNKVEYHYKNLYKYKLDSLLIYYSKSLDTSSEMSVSEFKLNSILNYVKAPQINNYKTDIIRFTQSNIFGENYICSISKKDSNNYIVTLNMVNNYFEYRVDNNTIQTLETNITEKEYQKILYLTKKIKILNKDVYTHKDLFYEQNINNEYSNIFESIDLFEKSTLKKINKKINKLIKKHLKKEMRFFVK